MGNPLIKGPHPPQQGGETVTFNIKVPKGFGKPIGHVITFMNEKGVAVVNLSNSDVLTHMRMTHNVMGQLIKHTEQKVQQAEGEGEPTEVPDFNFSKKWN